MHNKYWPLNIRTPPPFSLHQDEGGVAHVLGLDLESKDCGLDLMSVQQMWNESNLYLLLQKIILNAPINNHNKYRISPCPTPMTIGFIPKSIALVPQPQMQLML